MSSFLIVSLLSCIQVPTFCVKRIGQSSTTPCQLNTLTLTLAATTKLIAQDSIITLSNMDGVLSQTQHNAVMQLSDGTFGQGHNTYFAASHGGLSGTGHWNQSEAKLRLFLVQGDENDVDAHAHMRAFAFFLSLFLTHAPTHPHMHMHNSYANTDIECGGDVVISFDILNPGECRYTLTSAHTKNRRVY